MPARHAAARVPAAVLLLVLALVASACGSGGGSGTGGSGAPIRVGSSDDPVNRLLAEIYATALQIRGETVERRDGVGVPGLLDGAVDLVPTSTGDLLAALDPRGAPPAPGGGYGQIVARLPPRLRALQPSAAQDGDAVVVTRAAYAGGVRSLADLAPRCPSSVAAAPAGSPVVPALAAVYGCSFRTVRPASGDGAAAALGDGTVQAAVVRTTDPVIASGEVALLDDPRGAIPAQQVLPVIDVAALGHPQVADVLDLVSSRLDTGTLADLHRRVSEPGADPAQVARDWLSSAGIG